MEITLTVNGKQVKATVDDKEMKEAMGEKKKKRNGYEVTFNGYIATEAGDIANEYYPSAEVCKDSDEYQTANFYTDKKVAENNARADALMRKLRRFAAEHGGCVPPKNYIMLCNDKSDRYVLFYNRISETIECSKLSHPTAFEVAFETQSSAEKAIKIFHDDLLWYFTEYDPMPNKWWDNNPEAYE